MLTPNTLLQNRYRIVRQLGQGGMGTVYEALDERLNTIIALKETSFADEQMRKQFEREALLLARLHHPALPKVSDHFTEGDGQFLVMQFIPGEDLEEMRKRKGGKFPVDVVLSWGDQLLDALDYLHTQELPIIHRDIKPQNLKLTKRGQIILLDFGLAKGFAGEVSQVTTSGSIFGYTPSYAPLEQIQGTGTDPRSDFYSLAATLYHLMTGKRPPDALMRANAVLNGAPDPLLLANEIIPEVSIEISSILRQAMALKRDHRPTSAAKMRKDLKNANNLLTDIGDKQTLESASTLTGPVQLQHEYLPSNVGSLTTIPLHEQPTIKQQDTGQNKSVTNAESKKVPNDAKQYKDTSSISTLKNYRIIIGVSVLLAMLLSSVLFLRNYLNKGQTSSVTESPLSTTSSAPSASQELELRYYLTAQNGMNPTEWTDKFCR